MGITGSMPSRYGLVPFKCSPVWKRSLALHQHYQFICLKNTLQCVGWAFFKHCFTVECLIEDFTTRYQPHVASSSFHRHPDTHKSEAEEQENLVNPPHDVSNEVIVSASNVCAFDNIPLSLVYDRKGMMLVCQTLMEVGQQY